jgi:hypothetical protein
MSLADDIKKTNARPVYLVEITAGRHVQNALAAMTAVTLSGTVPSTSQVNLSWTSATSTQGYKVYRDGSLITTTTSLTYNDTGRSAGTTYQYTVYPYNGIGTGPVSNTLSKITLCAAPTSPAVNITGTTTATFSWVAPTGAATYKIYRGTSSGALSLIASGHATTSYNDTGLTSSTTYYYAVVATNASGDSAQSSEASGTTLSGFVNLVYAMGGYDGAYKTTNEEFDLVALVWSGVAPLTAARYQPTSFQLGTKIYTALGTDGTYRDATYEFDHVANSFTTKAAGVAKAYAHGAKIGTDKGYAPAGFDGSYLTSNGQSGDAWTAKQVFGAALAFHSASGVGSDKYYATHGSKSGTATAENNEYSESGNVFTGKQANNVASSGAKTGLGQATIGSLVYTFGGFRASPAGIVGILDTYSPAGNAWTGLTAALGRQNTSFACADSDKAHAVGGDTTGGPNPVGTTQEYSVAGAGWTSRNACTARYGLTSTGI